MADVKFASLSYPQSSNLGDDIQTLAGEQFLPRVDRYIDRDALDQVSGDERYVTMMNGWYLERPEHWPPGRAIIPVLTGFHITPSNRSVDLLVQGAGAEFLAANQPIGCRDHFTRDLLRERGIAAEYVGCPTTTFPARGPAPEADLVILVQTEGIGVPATLARNALRVAQRVPKWASPQTRRALAMELLDLYRRRARLVVTTKLHCALPCAAMGIPVVLFGNPGDPRLTPAVEAIGVNEYRAERHAASFGARALRRRENGRIAREVDWEPAAPELSDIKGRLHRDITARVEGAIALASGS